MIPKASINGVEGLATVRAHHQVFTGDINSLRIRWIGNQMHVVIRPCEQANVFSQKFPGVSAVIRAIEPFATVRAYQRPSPAWFGLRKRKSYSLAPPLLLAGPDFP